MYQEPVPDLFLILESNQKQPLHARNSFKIRYVERGLSKSLKKLALFFLREPEVPIFQTYFFPEEQKEPGISAQSFFRLQNKFRKVSLLVIYYLTKFDDVI